MAAIEQGNRFHRNDLFNEEETWSFIKHSHEDCFASKRACIKQKAWSFVMTATEQGNRFRRNDLFNEEETRSFIKHTHEDCFASRRACIEQKAWSFVMTAMEQGNRSHRNDLFNEEETQSFIKHSFIVDCIRRFWKLLTKSVLLESIHKYISKFHPIRLHIPRSP